LILLFFVLLAWIMLRTVTQRIIVVPLHIYANKSTDMELDGFFKGDIIMKGTIKKSLAALGLVAMVAGFSSSASAITWTLSPDANALAFGQTVVTGVNEINFVDSAMQPQGIFGAGFTVSGGGSQTVFFDADLYSWDSYNAVTGVGTGYFDAFIVTVSTLGYYWNIAGTDPQTGNANTALWSWGGTNYADGILESYTTAPLPAGDALTLTTGVNSLYYISFVLDTQSSPQNDTLHPSYGSFHVEVPEPSMLALLGIGLFAVAVAGRRASRRKDWA
jgi:hypothetical protein